MALHWGLVQLMKPRSVQLLPQVEALSLLGLLSHSLVLPAYLQQVLVVGVVVSLPFAVGSLLFVHAGETMPRLGPELEVHAALQIQAAVGLSERIPGKGRVRQALSSCERSHEGSHASPV